MNFDKVKRAVVLSWLRFVNSPFPKSMFIAFCLLVFFDAAWYGLGIVHVFSLVNSVSFAITAVLAVSIGLYLSFLVMELRKLCKSVPE